MTWFRSPSLVLVLAAAPAAARGQDLVPGDVDQGVARELRWKLERARPEADDWSAEKAAAALGPALARIAGACQQADGPDEAALAGVCTAEARIGGLGGGERELIRRGVVRIETTPPGKREGRGPSALAAELRRLTRVFGRVSRLETHVRRVELPSPGEARLLLSLEMAGTAEDGGARQLRADWTVDSRSGLITAVDSGPIAFATGPAGGLFGDGSAAALGSEGVYGEQFAAPLESWRERIQADLGVSFLGHAGVAVGDADGDGLEDLFCCQPGGLPNRLFVRNADGTARDVSREARVDYLDESRAALFADLDRDGDQDLAVQLGGDVVLLANDGTGRFAGVLGLSAPVATSLAAADYDLDGDLDLYVCGYVDPYSSQGTPVPYHDANNGQRNALWRNDVGPEGWRFTDVTQEVGLDENNLRFSFAASWADWDQDGDPDLYVANDFGRNNLYRNDGGRFRDVAAEVGVEDVAAGMGVAWGDVDGDTRQDLYVSNMESNAGGRVTFSEEFAERPAAGALAAYRRHAAGNSLYTNAGDHFLDRTRESGLERGRWAWGARLADLDNDGWLDAVVPNGFVTNERRDDL